VIDATNDFDPVGLDGATSSEIVAELTPGARLVKAPTLSRRQSWPKILVRPEASD
jgi:hypothetical protein